LKSIGKSIYETNFLNVDIIFKLKEAFLTVLYILGKTNFSDSGRSNLIGFLNKKVSLKDKERLFVVL
jgi:hypothetical protein